MIRLQYIDLRGQPHEVNASRVVVLDGNHCTPIAYVVEPATGFYEIGCTKCLGPAGFMHALKELGISQTTVVTQMRTRELPPIAIEP